jgi:hypothetical protein
MMGPTNLIVSSFFFFFWGGGGYIFMQSTWNTDKNWLKTAFLRDIDYLIAFIVLIE